MSYAGAFSIILFKFHPGKHMIDYDIFRDTMISNLGIEFLPPEDGIYRATMPVNSHSCQHMGVVCGGANLALAEITAGYASIHTLGEQSSSFAVGQQVSANHIASAPLGSVLTASATALHLGRTSHVWSVDIADQNGRRICAALVTNAVIRKPDAGSR